MAQVTIDFPSMRAGTAMTDLRWEAPAKIRWLGTLDLPMSSPAPLLTHACSPSNKNESCQQPHQPWPNGGHSHALHTQQHVCIHCLPLLHSHPSVACTVRRMSEDEQQLPQQTSWADGRGLAQMRSFALLVMRSKPLKERSKVSRQTHSLYLRCECIFSKQNPTQLILSALHPTPPPTAHIHVANTKMWGHPRETKKNGRDAALSTRDRPP